MSNRLERVVRMEEEINRGRYPTVSKFCELFEVQERTVYEDIRFLKERVGLDIEYDHFHKGYFNANPKKQLPQLQLSDGEVFALTLGKEMLSQYTGTSFEHILRGALEKIYKSLPGKVEIDLSDIRSMVKFSPGPIVGVSHKMFLDLNRACEKNIPVSIEYFSASKGEITERTIEPYKLLEHRGGWYVVAHCCLRKALRLFALHRIKVYRLLDARFSPLEDKDIDDWVKSAFLLEHGEREEQVEIIFSKDAARYIRERRWHPSQELQENEDGSCSLKFITQSVDEVRRWVLTYGAQAEVIKPLELRELLRSDALALVQKYGTEKVAST